MTITQMNTQKKSPARQQGFQNLPGKPQVASATTSTSPATAGIMSGLKDVRDTTRALQLQKAANGSANTSRDYAAEILPAVGQPRSAANVEKVKTLADAREVKTQLPEYSKYAGDDVQQMARVYTAAPGYRDDVDYASYIQHISMLPPTAENMDAMRGALAARKAKIAAGGDATAQYANDEVQQMAEQYLKQYAPTDADLTPYYDRAEKIASDQRADTNTYLAEQEMLQREATKKAFDEARRQADIAYAQQSRANENLLAEQGLGRGLGAGPSSGYSETARAGALANYANNINKTYVDQEAAEREIAAQIAAARLEADTQYRDAMLQNQYARVQQANADREHGFAAHQFNTGLGQDKEALDYQKERDASSDAYRDDVFDYQKERDTVADSQFDRSFARQEQRDAVEDSHWDQSFDYQKERDTVADSQFDRTFDYQKEIDRRNFDQWKAEFDANQLWNEKDYEIAYMNALKRSAPKVTRPTYTGSSYGNNIISDIESKLAPDDEEVYGPSPVPPVTNGNFWHIG